MFWAQNVLDPKRSGPKTFWTQNVLGPKRSGPKTFWTQKVWTQHVPRPKTFWIQSVVVILKQSKPTLTKTNLFFFVGRRAICFKVGVLFLFLSLYFLFRLARCCFYVGVFVIEGPLGKAHRRPSICDRRALHADMRRRACYWQSAIAGNNHHEVFVSRKLLCSATRWGTCFITNDDKIESENMKIPSKMHARYKWC